MTFLINCIPTDLIAAFIKHTTCVYLNGNPQQKQSPEHNKSGKTSSQQGKCENSWKIAVREISRAHTMHRTRVEQRKCARATAFSFSLFSPQPLFAGKSSCILSRPKKIYRELKTRSFVGLNCAAFHSHSISPNPFDLCIFSFWL